jgi:hypothetical protein
MTTPSEPDNGQPAEGVNLGKGDAAGDAPSDPAADAPFDPYRFGKPDHPIPAEYAPPGYTGPVTPPPSPYEQPNPFGPPAPYGSQPSNPFNNPPGTPYGGAGQQAPQLPPQQPYQYPPTPYGQPGPYGPSAPGPYGPPPGYHGYGQQRTGNGKAIAALVLGILSIVMFWLTIFDAIFVILALIFGLIALSESKRANGNGRGMAIAGLVCTAVGALAATIFTVVIVHAANQCGGINNSDVPGWDQCVRDHIG